MAKNCCICGKDLGMSSTKFKISGGEVVCKTCFNTAGYGMTTSYAIIRKLTPDKLKQDINHKENAGTRYEEILKRLDEIGVTDTFGTKKEIKHLPEILHDTELIMYATSGFYNGNTVLIICTDNRVIFFDKGMLYGTNKTEIPLDKINSVSYSKGLVLASLKMFNGASQMQIDNISKNTVEKLASTIKESSEKYTQKLQNSIGNQTTIVNQKSPVEQVKEMKDLLDMGIITSEEFERKKNELLGL